VSSYLWIGRTGSRSLNHDGDTQLVTAPLSLPKHVIACAGAAGAAAAPPTARSDALLDDGTTLKPESPVDRSAAPANMKLGQHTDAPAQRLLLNRYDRYEPGLGYPESILQNTHGSAASLRAQKSPLAYSLSMSISSSASARSLLRWSFS